jgi:putative transposase
LPPDVRKSLVESHEKLSQTKQTGLLEIGRTSIYARPRKGISDETIQLMHKIDRIHTDEPTWGYRMITSYLRNAFGIVVNRKRVRRLMREMGIYAIYPKPNLSKLYHAQYVRPYLLRNMDITRPDQVWGVDITYITMGRSFIYLFVIIDWYSRYIVDWELSSTLDKGFVLTCMRRALGRCRPEIINSDQGGHFTNPDYIALLEESGVRISMDGKGQCLDNVRTERFFRTLKYDRVYINEYASPREIRQMLKTYMPHYNNVRPHTSADGLPPAVRYQRKEVRVAESFVLDPSARAR